jgi:hypothetical protein
VRYFLSRSEENQKILVYIQAIPASIPRTAKKFSDLEACDFQMSHSSKVALGLASRGASGEIVATGFSPVLNEAVARGASTAFSMPLCDDPLEQLKFFPREEKFSSIIVGESPDWVFSGSSLCGVIATRFGLQLCVHSSDEKLEGNSVTLVLDSGNEAPNVDVRRISQSAASTVNPEGVLGRSTLKKLEEKKPELLTGSVEEVSSVVSRRIRRLNRQWRDRES